MIYFVATPQTNRFAVYEFVLAYAKELQSRLRFINAVDLLARTELPEARAWIFTATLDEVDAHAHQQLIAVEQRLREARQRMLNAPSQTLARYDLLRQLYAAKVNSFQVHRHSDTAPRRYPVFIRSSRAHDGSQTGLLNNAEDIRLTLLEDPRLAHDDMMIAEFCNVRSGDGLYRKYSIMRIGDSFVPRHILFSNSWVTKTADVAGPAMAFEEEAFLTAVIPPEILTAFELAGVQYGRIDFGMLKGRPQIWEINLNPLVVPRLSRMDSQRHKAQKQSAKLVRTAFEALLT